MKKFVFKNYRFIGQKLSAYTAILFNVFSSNYVKYKTYAYRNYRNIIVNVTMKLINLLISLVKQAISSSCYMTSARLGQYLMSRVTIPSLPPRQPSLTLRVSPEAP